LNESESKNDIDRILENSTEFNKFIARIKGQSPEPSYTRNEKPIEEEYKEGLIDQNKEKALFDSNQEEDVFIKRKASHLKELKHQTISNSKTNSLTNFYHISSKNNIHSTSNIYQNINHNNNSETANNIGNLINPSRNNNNPSIHQYNPNSVNSGNQNPISNENQYQFTVNSLTQSKRGSNTQSAQKAKPSSKNSKGNNSANNSVNKENSKISFKSNKSGKSGEVNETEQINTIVQNQTAYPHISNHHNHNNNHAFVSSLNNTNSSSNLKEDKLVKFSKSRNSNQGTKTGGNSLGFYKNVQTNSMTNNQGGGSNNPANNNQINNTSNNNSRNHINNVITMDDTEFIKNMKRNMTKIQEKIEDQEKLDEIMNQMSSLPDNDENYFQSNNRRRLHNRRRLMMSSATNSKSPSLNNTMSKSPHYNHIGNFKEKEFEKEIRERKESTRTNAKSKEKEYGNSNEINIRTYNHYNYNKKELNEKYSNIDNIVEDQLENQELYSDKGDSRGAKKKRDEGERIHSKFEDKERELSSGVHKNKGEGSYYLQAREKLSSQYKKHPSHIAPSSLATRPVSNIVTRNANIKHINYPIDKKQNNTNYNLANNSNLYFQQKNHNSRSSFDKQSLPENKLHSTGLGLGSAVKRTYIKKEPNNFNMIHTHTQSPYNHIHSTILNTNITDPMSSHNNEMPKQSRNSKLGNTNLHNNNTYTSIHTHSGSTFNSKNNNLNVYKEINTNTNEEFVPDMLEEIIEEHAFTNNGEKDFFDKNDKFKKLKAPLSGVKRPYSFVPTGIPKVINNSKNQYTYKKNQNSVLEDNNHNMVLPGIGSMNRIPTLGNLNSNKNINNGTNPNKNISEAYGGSNMITNTGQLYQQNLPTQNHPQQKPVYSHNLFSQQKQNQTGYFPDIEGHKHMHMKLQYNNNNNVNTNTHFPQGGKIVQGGRRGHMTNNTYNTGVNSRLVNNAGNIINNEKPYNNISMPYHNKPGNNQVNTRGRFV